MYVNTSYASSAPEKYFYIILYTYLIPLRRRRIMESTYIDLHRSGAGEVFVYNYLAPEKLEKYLYTPHLEELYGYQCVHHHHHHGAVHKVRHAILANVDPPSPVTLCHTSRNPPSPRKYVTHLGLYIFD